MAQDIPKMETTQTAVEWLVKELSQELDYIPIKQWDRIRDLVQQAKAMEKEQMHKCASFWRGKENEIEKPIFEQYYNQTYGS